MLSINQIHHTYLTHTSANTVLEDISLFIEEGEFISFLGPSGCGKTTLLSIVAGLIEPTEGNVTIHNKPIKDVLTQIGYMLQHDYLFPWKTIKENVLMGLKIMNKRSDEAEQQTLALLRMMDLGDVEEMYPRQLSGGMRQRVALVRTLATNPSILLLDEPFSALDFQTKLKLEDLVSSTLKDFHKTALLVTHDIGESIAMSDRIFLFAPNPGRIANIFTVPEELRNLSPLEVRQHHRYNELFQDIWKELDSLGKNEY